MKRPESGDSARWLKRLMLAGILTAAVFGMTIAAANLIVLLKGNGSIYTNAADAPKADVAIVPGAFVKPDGTMSLMLADRVNQAVTLYEEGKVNRFLVSGDHGGWDYNEPMTMRRAMIAAGVPGDAIFTDHAGFNTRATMERARNIFDIESAIIVTQGFHMKRSLFLAEEAGLKASGLTSDLHPYGGMGVWSDLREVGSRTKAVIDTVAGTSVVGGPSVPITGPASASWGPDAPAGTPPAGAPTN